MKILFCIYITSIAPVMLASAYLYGRYANKYTAPIMAFVMGIAWPLLLPIEAVATLLAFAAQLGSDAAYAKERQP